MVQPGYYIRFEVNGTFGEIFNLLRPRFGNISHHIHKQDEYPVWGVLLGSQHFMRVESEVAITIIIHNQPDSVILEVTGYAGGKGLLSVSYGAHRAMAEQVTKYLQEHGFKFQIQFSGALG
jgi:hypothetical protein